MVLSLYIVFIVCGPLEMDDSFLFSIYYIIGERMKEIVFEGVVFQSELHARWAVLFHVCKLRWKYCPQPSPSAYSSQFQLWLSKRIYYWVTVLPEQPSDDVKEERRLVAQETGQPIMLLWSTFTEPLFIGGVRFYKETEHIDQGLGCHIEMLAQMYPEFAAGKLKSAAKWKFNDRRMPKRRAR